MPSFCRNNCSDKGLLGRQPVCRTIVGQEPCWPQACSYEAGSHYLLTNQPTISFQKVLNYFYHLCSVSSFFIYQTNVRSNQAYEPARPTNKPTNQIKSSERQNKVFAKTPIGPFLTPQILKMTTTNELKINLIP